MVITFILELEVFEEHALIVLHELWICLQELYLLFIQTLI